MLVCGIPNNLFLNNFLQSSLLRFFIRSLLGYDANLMFFSNIKEKEMRFKAVLGDLERKIFFGTQPWRAAFKTDFTVIFVRKPHKSFLKS